MKITLSLLQSAFRSATSNSYFLVLSLFRFYNIVEIIFRERKLTHPAKYTLCRRAEMPYRLHIERVCRCSARWWSYPSVARCLCLCLCASGLKLEANACCWACICNPCVSCLFFFVALILRCITFRHLVAITKATGAHVHLHIIACWFVHRQWALYEIAVNLIRVALSCSSNYIFIYLFAYNNTKKLLYWMLLFKLLGFFDVLKF